MAKFIPSGTLQIEAQQFDWEILHYAQMTTTSQNANGLSVCVWLSGARAKELIVNFPVIGHNYDRPKNPGQFEKRLALCVKQALEQGWNPEKRGKPFRFDSEQPATD